MVSQIDFFSHKIWLCFFENSARSLLNCSSPLGKVPNVVVPSKLTLNLRSQAKGRSCVITILSPGMRPG